MIRGNCDVCHENLFEGPDPSFLEPLPRKITCLGCGRRFSIFMEKGILLFRRMGTKKNARPLRPVSF